MSAHPRRLALLVCLFLAGHVVAFGQPPVVGDKEFQGPKTPSRMDRHGDPLPDGAVARLGSRRFHHSWGIRNMAFSPDGKTVLAIGWMVPYSLIFWETTSGKEIKRFTVDYELQDSVFSPDGKTVALLGRNSIELFDWRAGKRLFTFGNKLDLQSLAFSPDGALLVAGCMEYKADNPIRVWEVATGRELAPFGGSGASVRPVQFSADGKKLLSGTEGVTFHRREGMIPPNICVWDVATRKKLHEIPNAPGPVVFAPDGQTIARETSDQKIQVVNITTGKELHLIPARNASFAFTPDGKALVSSDPDQGVRLLALATGKVLRRFHGHFETEKRLGGISPNGKLLALLGGRLPTGMSIRFWDLATGEEIRHGSGHQDTVTSVAYARGGKLLATGSLDRTVRLWDAVTGKELRTLEGHKTEVSAVAFAPDGLKLASASADGVVRLWDVADGKVLAQLDGPPTGLAVLVFSPDGKSLIAGFREGQNSVFVWDLTSRMRVQHFKTGDEGLVFALAPDGKVALSANGDKRDLKARETVLLWKTVTGKRLRGLPLREGQVDFSHVPIHGAAFSADSRLFVTSEVLATNEGLRTSYSGPKIRLWERATGQEILTIENTISSVLAFAPNGRFLATGYGGAEFFFDDRRTMIGLWDPLTGKKTQDLSGHWSTPTCLAFSPDGTHLASGSVDHTVLIWEVPHSTAKPTAATTAKELQAWWADLSGDAALAHKAFAALVARPTQALVLFREHLQPVPLGDVNKIAGYVQDLGSPRFAVRNQASMALEQFGEVAGPFLKKALGDPVPLEQQRRLQQLLDKLDGIPGPSQRRLLRAVAALEWIDNAEARLLLGALTKGAAGARLTQEARASLQRLEQRVR